MKHATEVKDRTFSIELRSRAGLRNVTLANGACDRVLVDGTIGELERVSIAEGVVLEVVGKGGTLRVDLREDEIRRTLQTPVTGGESR